MKIERVLLFLLTVVAVFALAGAGSGRTAAQDVDPVEVVNFPRLQEVEGGVRVTEPVPHAELDRVKGVLVGPVDRHDSTNLVEAGTITADRFTHAVLSLRGEVRGNLGQEGRVGAILLPDEEPVRRTFLQTGRFQFPLEVTAPVRRTEAGYFSSESLRTPLAFPRYRVLLYNGTDRSVEVDLYVYKTN